MVLAFHLFKRVSLICSFLYQARWAASFWRLSCFHLSRCQRSMGLQDATRSSFWWILGILTQFQHWAVSPAPFLAFGCGFFDMNTDDHAYSVSTLSSESLPRPPLGRSPKGGILSPASCFLPRVSRGVAPAFWCRWSPTYPRSCVIALMVCLPFACLPSPGNSNSLNPWSQAESLHWIEEQCLSFRFVMFCTAT